MAIRIFNPKTRSFQSINNDADLPFDQLVLLNILAELQAQTMLLHANGPGLPADDPHQLRTAVFQE